MSFCLSGEIARERQFAYSVSFQMDGWVLDKKPCPGKTFSVVDQMECPGVKLKLYIRMYRSADMR
jgi:hypothetical protein